VVEFKFNEAGMKNLVRELKDQLGDIQIPLDGSEANAVRTVKDQLRARGVAADDQAVEQLVRNARSG
jgi:hypothetical protein